MFLDEIAERSTRLIDGGQAMQKGGADAEMAGIMLREGHTIKGTARVMGFEAISVAGKMIEDLWRGVKSGEIEPYPNLGRALVALAESLPDATGADPDAGSEAMNEAMERLNRATGYMLGDAVPAADQPAPAAEPADVAGQPAEEAIEEPMAEVVPLPGALQTAVPPQEPAAPPEPDPEPVPAAADPPPAPEPGPAAPPPAEEPAEPARRPPVPEPEVAAPPPVAPRQVPLATPGEMIGSVVDEEAEVYAPDLGGLLGALENWASGQTIQVSAGRLYRLINYVAGLRVELDSLLAQLRYQPTVSVEMVDHMADLVRSTAALELNAMELGAVPVRQMTNTLPQLVRYLAKKLEKEVRFEISAADDLDIDRQVLDKISDPVRQLIVNAVNHGIESPAEREAAGKAATGVIAVTLTRRGNSFEVVVADDGAGIDYAMVRQLAVSQGLVAADSPVDDDALRPILFFPGFTTSPGGELNSVGAGLSNVADAVESLYGRIRIESTLGEGTTVTIVVPTVRDLQRVLIVDSGGMKWAIPEAVIDEVIPIESAHITSSGGRRTLTLENRELPVAPIADIVGAVDTRSEKQVVAIAHRAGFAAVTVNEVVGIREVAAKELGPVVAGPSHITGAALMGGGDVVLILDAGSVVQLCQAVPRPVAPRARILVVDDSQGARAVIAGSLASSGFSTSVAESAFEALEVLGEEHVDALVVDFSMPVEDGVDLVRKIRATKNNLPIVMLSGVAKEEDQQRAIEAGVDAFFEKADFREGALAAQLRTLLDQG
jgi:two-component system chemotaxis sensor kinase CheA